MDPSRKSTRARQSICACLCILLCMGVCATFGYVAYYFWNEKDKLFDEYYDKYYKGECLAMSNRIDIERQCDDDDNCHNKYTAFCTLNETTVLVVDELEIAKSQDVSYILEVIGEKCLKNNTYTCYVNIDANTILYDKSDDKAHNIGLFEEVLAGIFCVFGSLIFAFLVIMMMTLTPIDVGMFITDNIFEYFDEIKYKYCKKIVDKYESNDIVINTNTSTNTSTNTNQISSMEHNNNNNATESTSLLINSS